MVANMMVVAKAFQIDYPKRNHYDLVLKKEAKNILVVWEDKKKEELVKKFIVIIVFVVLISFFEELFFFSLCLDLISKSWMSGIFAENLLKHFFPISTSQMRDPIRGFFDF